MTRIKKCCIFAALINQNSSYMKTRKLKSQRAFSYRIDDVESLFGNLYDAKKHFSFYSSQEIVKNFYPKTYICGYYLKGELISITDVDIDENGNYRFGKTCKNLFPCATRL